MLMLLLLDANGLLPPRRGRHLAPWPGASASPRPQPHEPPLPEPAPHEPPIEPDRRDGEREAGGEGEGEAVPGRTPPA
ncbi:MAG: hypothetical protein JNL85_01020 [Rubrivivax sp.]|nr:hypothetical protein [Rubrivivax sp.]